MKHILVCNRGLPALKFLLSFKEWQCDEPGGQYRLFGFVSDADIAAQYKYITLLDQQIYVEKKDNIYTDIDEILAYCERYSIDIVFPGWGYLSENAEFVRRLENIGIQFIGPTAEAMDQIGNKISCNDIAERLGVPVLPWSGDQQLLTLDSIVAHAKRITYPVMLKAGNSGGGKGIRIVHRQEDLAVAWQEILAEVKNPMIYVTKYIEKASHFEIQILGDGVSCRHLHGRDCSTQRRNQKLVEECPITQADRGIIESIENYAVDMLTTVKYRGLATVEFIYDQRERKVYILEVNPRLQVEHIITEQLFNINLIKIQFLLSTGHRLSSIPDLANLDYTFKKHIISVRINSENPYEDFRPILGRLDLLDMTYSKNTWGYFSMETGGVISGNVDSQFGHILAVGKDRNAAINNMVNLIERAKITGSVYNTTSFLKNYIMSSTFRNNRHYTRYLHEAAIGTLVNPTRDVMLFMAMIYLAYLDNAPREKECLASITRGHSFLLNEYHRLKEGLIVYKDVMHPYKYVFKLPQEAATQREIILNYKMVFYKATCHFYKNYMIMFDQGMMYKIEHGYRDDYSIEIIINNQKYNAFHKLKDNTIKSPVGGKIVECIFKDGDLITAGQEYVKIECMKMLINFKAEKTGIITYRKKKGDIVYPNENLAFIASDEPSNYTLSKGIANLEGYITDQVDFSPPVQTDQLDCPIYVDIDTYPSYFTDNPEDIRPWHSEEDGGIKAWEIKLCGKPFVLLANNLKWRNGTFSYTEDAFYFKILHYARMNRLPFVFIASNSGADINLNERVKFMAKPWGTEYLYLTEEDYALVKNQVRAEYHSERGHYILSCINNKGIVNLDGSALLVSEMAKARQEIPTFTFVIDRTVGVGAYLAKLSERIVQRRDSAIILTGYQALNKVIGNNLYESNLQLGGPQIMGANGISQKIVDTTGEGFAYLKTMLCFILAPVMPAPRALPAQDLMGHIIDAGTFLETMNSYAKTVITGRARIGGQAYAVIYNNEAITEKFIPCDPANLATEVSYLKQSPNILYPDTSYKIAKTIHTANIEGLPLLLICDWRGFSGGTRDMYANVLDFGSMIVTELTAYKQKVWVYIPPYGQLRGGSMVVFSKSINPECITLCVSKHAKINVLEPNAAKELKYKQKDIEKYAVEHNVSNDTADKIAMMYTELNDVVNSDYTILEQADAPKIIDYVIEPLELRKKICLE